MPRLAVFDFCAAPWGKTRSSLFWGVPGAPLIDQLLASFQLAVLVLAPVQKSVLRSVRSSRRSVTSSTRDFRWPRRLGWIFAVVRFRPSDLRDFLDSMIRSSG